MSAHCSLPARTIEFAMLDVTGTQPPRWRTCSFLTHCSRRTILVQWPADIAYLIQRVSFVPSGVWMTQQLERSWNKLHKLLDHVCTTIRNIQYTSQQPNVRTPLRIPRSCFQIDIHPETRYFERSCFTPLLHVDAEVVPEIVPEPLSCTLISNYRIIEL